MHAALAAYEAERSVEVLKLQNAARNSTEWFENVDRYTSFDAMQFAYSLLTRSQRISHENLRLRDAGFVARAEGWFAERAHAGAEADRAPPPMFTPFTLRGVTLANRVVVSPMAQYSCVDGLPGRLLPRASRQPRARRRRARVHRNDLRRGGCADQPGLRRLVRRCARRGVAAHRRLRARAHERKHRAAARTRGPEGLDAARLGGCRRAARAGQLAADRAIGHRVRPAQPGAARDVGGRHGARADGVRYGDASRDRVRLRLARAPLRARLPAVGLPVSADEPSRRRVRRNAREPLPLSARGLSRDARRMACGAADVGSHFRARLGAGRQHAGRRGRDRAALQGGRRRPDRRQLRPDDARGAARLRHACTRRRSPTASATKSASRRWRSARSSSRTT